MQVGTTNGKARAAAVRIMVEQDADAIPKRECFVRVSGIVKSLQGKLAVLDGEVELLWQIYALEKKDDMELNEIRRIQRCFGADSVLKREHAYEFDVPHTSAESREQWPCGDGGEVFRDAKDEYTTGIKSLAFYPSLACIHLTIYFDGLCLKQDGLAIGATPLNRRCLRLELVRNPMFPHVRFVANAAVVTRNKLRPLLPRVAASIVSPPSFLLTPELARSWQMGPKPTVVQGIDFSGLFSNDALVLIVFQMHAQLVRVQVVLPGCVTGTLIFLAWSLYCAFAVRLTLLLGALMTFLLTSLNIMFKRQLLLSRYILTYGIFVLGVLAVAFVSIVASQNAHAGDSCGNIDRGGHQNSTSSFAAVESIWLGLHVLLLRACGYDAVRGTWEDCVAKAKLQSVSKPAQMLNPGTASLPRRAQELASIEPSRNKVAPQDT